MNAKTATAPTNNMQSVELHLGGSATVLRSPSSLSLAAVHSVAFLAKTSNPVARLFDRSKAEIVARQRMPVFAMRFVSCGMFQKRVNRSVVVYSSRDDFNVSGI